MTYSTSKEGLTIPKDISSSKRGLTVQYESSMTSVTSNDKFTMHRRIIDLRQNLAKFVNGIENLSKLLKYNKSPHDKSGLGFEKEKKIKEKPNIHCSTYRKFGHRSYTYRERSKDLQGLTQKDPIKFGYLNQLFLLHMCLIVGRKPLSWYLDSGCSHHMMGEKYMFQDLMPKKGGWVAFGVGIGRIGKHPFPSIENVLYVKRLKHNLLSISQLYYNVYNVSFNKGECIVRDCNDFIILFVKRQKNLYKIDLTNLIN
ncbi:hypothetical protein CR513_45107, partial [Mucuna pruriens]